MLPSAIADALADVELSALPGIPTDATCAGAEYHSPTPLVLHEVDGHLLCGTCRANYQVLQALLTRERHLSWEVRRSFGNRLRHLLIPKEPDV